MYIFHKRIAKGMEQVHKATSAFSSARRVLEERPDIFGETPQKSISLLATLNKVAPDQYFWSVSDGESKRVTEDRKLLEFCGGMKEVARNAQSAREAIPEIERVLEKETTAFENRSIELKTEEKAARKKRNLSVLGLFSSIGVVTLSSYLIKEHYSTNNGNKMLLAGAILGVLVSIFGVSASFVSLDKYTRASGEAIRQAVGRMRKSLEELKQSLEEIVCNVPFRF